MQQSTTPFTNEAKNLTLFDRYGEIIFAYIRVHTATREDAEDLTVEVFAAACENDNLSALSKSTEQLAWLKRVAHNKRIDHYRWQNRNQVTNLDQFKEVLLTEKTLPEEIALQHEEHKELREYISRLSPIQQRVLHLRYGNELNSPEIAIIIGKREGAVRQLLARTIKQLRVLYQQTDQR